MQKSYRVGKFPWRAVAAMLLAGVLIQAPPAMAVILADPTAGAGITSLWDGVGKFLFGSTQSGCGTMLDDRHVLTAAHLFYNPSNSSFYDTSNYSFTVGGQTYQLPSGAVKIASGFGAYTIYTDKSSHQAVTTYQNDLAIVTLPVTLTGVSSYAWNDGSVTETSATNGVLNGSSTSARTGRIVGLGIGGDGTGGASSSFPVGTERQGQNYLDYVTNVGSPLTLTSSNIPSSNNRMTLPGGLLVFDFAATGNAGPLGSMSLGNTEADTSDGDSGSPLFQWDSVKSRYVVSGVTADGLIANSTFGDIGWDTRVASFNDFISQNVPEPTCIGPLLIGSLLLLKRRSKQ